MKEALLTNHEIKLIAEWWNQGWRAAEIRAMLKTVRSTRKRSNHARMVSTIDSNNHGDR